MKLIPVMLPLAHISLTGAIYITIAISLERYNMVIKPFNVVSFEIYYRISVKYNMFLDEFGETDSDCLRYPDLRGQLDLQFAKVFRVES